MSAKYEFFARSASDRDPHWPVWFVARRDMPGRNVTVEACEIAGILRAPGATLGTKDGCEFIAAKANGVAK